MPIIIEVRVRYVDGSRPDQAAKVTPTTQEYEAIRHSIAQPEHQLANIAEYCTDALAFAFMSELEVYEQSTPDTEIGS